MKELRGMMRFMSFNIAAVGPFAYERFSVWWEPFLFGMLLGFSAMIGWKDD